MLNKRLHYYSKGKVVPAHNIRMYREMEMQQHSFLALALDGDK